MVIQTNPRIRGPKATSISRKEAAVAKKSIVDGFYSKQRDGVAFVEPKVILNSFRSETYFRSPSPSSLFQAEYPEKWQ
jgi:hypothetical protein